MRKNVSLKTYLATTLIITILCLSVVSYVYSLGSEVPISKGSFVKSPKFIIENDTSTIKVFDGFTGELKKSGSDLVTVWNWTRDNGLTSGRTWKEKVVLKGNFSIDATIYMPSYIILDMDDLRLTLADGTNANMIEEATGGVSYVDIIGGILDGNRAQQTSGNGIVFTGNSFSVRIFETTLYYIHTYGITLSVGHGLIQGVVTDHCIYGIYANGAFIKVLGCTTNNGYTHGIVVGHHEVLVSACTAYGNSQNGIALMEGATVIGCNVAYNGRHNIYLVSADNAKVIGNDANDLSATNYDSIALHDTINATIIGNKCFRINPYNMRYGISLLTVACQNNVIIGNVIVDATTANIYDAGSNNIIKDNIGFVTENSGTATDKANGGTVAHGLAGTPDIVMLTCLNATYDSEMVLVYWDQINTDSTNISLDIYWVNGTAITDGVIDVSWYVEYHP